MKRGVFIRAMCSAWPTAPCVPVSRSSLPIPDFAMSPPAKLDPGVDLFDDDDQKNIFWAVCDIECETFTQGAVGQAEIIALFKTPRFIVKFGDTGTSMFVSVML